MILDWRWPCGGQLATTRTFCRVRLSRRIALNTIGVNSRGSCPRKPFPPVTFLNPRPARWGGYVPLASARLVLVPASQDQWRDPVEDCAAGASGVLFLISNLTENI